MNTINEGVAMSETLKALLSGMGMPLRIAIISGCVIGAHVLVSLLRKVARRVVLAKPGSSLSKTRTIADLATSIAIFSVYFGALGLIWNEFGLSLKAYIASASFWDWQLVSAPRDLFRML